MILYSFARDLRPSPACDTCRAERTDSSSRQRPMTSNAWRVPDKKKPARRRSRGFPRRPLRAVAPHTEDCERRFRGRRQLRLRRGPGEAIEARAAEGGRVLDSPMSMPDLEFRNAIRRCDAALATSPVPAGRLCSTCSQPALPLIEGHPCRSSYGELRQRRIRPEPLLEAVEEAGFGEQHREVGCELGHMTLLVLAQRPPSAQSKTLNVLCVLCG